MRKLIDISVTLHPRMPVWTGSPGVDIQSIQSIEKGDIANVSQLRLDIHSGTHIDAPLHFVDKGKTTADIPLEILVGECLVVDLRGKSQITASDLEALSIPSDVKRLLLKTDNSAHWADPLHQFDQDFCALTADAAQWVVDHGIQLIGIDYHSIQLFHDPPDTHLILLRKEVVILEGLDLRSVDTGTYRLICLPIKIHGVEGASARAILEQI